LILRARPIACIAAVTPLALVLACGGGDDVPEDERVRQISGVAELATNAYAAAGPEGLYDYLSKEMVESCSKDALVTALEGEPVPEGFRGLVNTEVDGNEARAEVRQLFDEGERSVEWHFVLEDESWRITSVPGLEECGNG
jgi:hypothetical protein